jgi:hypothetical protein
VSAENLSPFFPRPELRGCRGHSYIVCLQKTCLRSSHVLNFVAVGATVTVIWLVTQPVKRQLNFHPPVNMRAPLQATVISLNLPGFSFIICSVYLPPAVLVPPAVSVICPAYSSQPFQRQKYSLGFIPWQPSCKCICWFRSSSL